MQGLYPADGDVIKGQYGYSQYHQEAGWAGSLQKLETGKSYRMYCAEQQSLRCVGAPVNLTKEPVPLNQGWTWIGFPAQDIMDLNHALKDLPAYPGDRIKSQTEYAEYIGSTGTWEGSLEKLVPGQGYMLKSVEGGHLHLPVLNKMTSGSLEKSFFYQEQPDWQLDIARYEYTMSLTAALMFNKTAMSDTALIVAAFSEGSCRGLAKLKYVPELSQYIAFLMIYAGDAAGDTIQFRVYDPAVNKVREVSESVVFSNDAIMGNMSDPTILNAQGIGDELVPYSYYLNQNYPNPFNPETVIGYGLPEAGDVKLEVYTILGQKVATLVNSRHDAGRYEVRFSAEEYLLANGIYFYQLRAGGFVTTRKLLVLK